MCVSGVLPRDFEVFRKVFRRARSTSRRCCDVSGLSRAYQEMFSEI